jgi:cell wall-associated NlpC family hydrolase
MKNLFIFLLFTCALVGCKVFQPGAGGQDNLSPSASNSNAGKSQPAFIQGITTESSARTRIYETPTVAPVPTKTMISTESSDYYEQLQFKYAILTNSPVEELTNQRLLIFMDKWYGAPYHYGGTTRDGIDCSAFTCLLMSDVYNISHLPRISHDQFSASKRVSKEDLKEGDLVFFHTLGKGHKVTHVGVYLYNNRFVHASVNGVQISDLGEGYYRQHFVGGGRVI